MGFTQESWNSLRRERAFNGLVALLEPELEAALEAPTCKSLKVRGPVKAPLRAELREGRQVRVVRDNHGGESWYSDDGRLVGFKSPVVRRTV